MHQLRDYLDRVCVTIVRQDERLHTIDEGFRRDPMTNLPNRLGLEHLLQEWWQQGRHQSQPLRLSFRSRRLHQAQPGPRAAAGNHVLHVVAERMRDCLGPNDLIVRYSGQRIAVFLSGVESTDAIEAAERIRQPPRATTSPAAKWRFRSVFPAALPRFCLTTRPKTCSITWKTLAEAKPAAASCLSITRTNARLRNRGDEQSCSDSLPFRCCSFRVFRGFSFSPCPPCLRGVLSCLSRPTYSSVTSRS